MDHTVSVFGIWILSQSEFFIFTNLISQIFGFGNEPLLSIFFLVNTKPDLTMTAILERRESTSLWGRFCNWITSTENRLYIGWFGVLMIPTLLTATSILMVFVSLFLVLLLYGNNIISGAIIPSAAIGLHFYPIWEAASVDEWLYNGGPYELIVLHFLLGVACYMGREWELSFRLGMRPWIAVAYSAPVAAATACFLDLPYLVKEVSPDGMPLGISGTFNFMIVFQAEHNILMHPFHMLGVAGVFGLIRETTENESANEGYKFGQEEETYNIFQQSRSLHFFLAAWPVVGIWFTALGISTMAFNLNGFNFNQSVVDSQGRVINTWADIINRANLGMEVMHERNAHNFPLDLAALEPEIPNILFPTGYWYPFLFRRKPNWLLPITAFPIDIGTFVPETIFLLFLCYGMNIPYQFVILTHSDHFSLELDNPIWPYPLAICHYFFEKGNGMVKPELLEERIFNSITWAPRIWGPWDNLFDCRDRYAEYDWGFSYGYWSGSKQIKEDELSETAIYSNYFWYIYHKKGEVQETDSDFLQSGTMQYQTRDISFKEEGFFRISQLIWDLRIHSFSYSKIRPLSLCFHVENSLQMKMKRWQSGLVPVPGEKSLLNIWLATVKKEQRMTKDETLLVFTLVVSSVSIFLFGILLFMVLISATRDFRERTKSKLVKIMIWAGIVVITFAIAVRIYPIFIFLLKERIKPLVEALYDKLPWIWEVSLSRYWDRLIDFLDRYLWACAQRIQTGIRKQKGEFVVTFSCRVKKRLYARAIEVGIHLSLLSNLFWILKTTLAVGYRLL
ncbi:hypothetical protein ACJX0J_002135 [Zea mays]